MNQTILVVDDTATERYLLNAHLGGEAYRVLEAEDGDQGFRLALEQQPDLILLDVMMPGRSGFDVCAMLKKEPRTRSIPVIFLTSLTDTEDKVRGLSEGAADYITKPFKSVEVLARVRAQLRIKALEQESLVQQRALWQADRLSRELRIFAFVWPVVVLASYLWNLWTTGAIPLAAGHGMLWLIGLGMTVWGDRRLRRSEDELEGTGLETAESPGSS